MRSRERPPRSHLDSCRQLGYYQPTDRHRGHRFHEAQQPARRRPKATDQHADPPPTHGDVPRPGILDMNRPTAMHRCLRAFGRMTGLPFGLRDRVLRLFADPDSMASTPFACDFFGATYDGDLASFIDWSVYFHGAYERGLLAFLANAAAQAGPDAVVLDVGANVGQHTLFLAGRAGQVHAFEPWPAAAEALARKIARNRLDNVTLHRVGLSDRTHDEVYYAPTGANCGTGSFLAAHNRSNRPAGTLPLAAGDDCLAAREIERVDVIKIDAEGYEPRVLAGLARTLSRRRPVVAFELSETCGRELAGRGDVETALTELFGEDWEWRRLEGGPDRYRLAPFRPVFDGATLAAIPAERLAGLPQDGGL